MGIWLPAWEATTIEHRMVQIRVPRSAILHGYLGASRARDMHVLSTDVAIIGGGAAGCYAALNLHRRGIKPLIICKGLVGKSGASIVRRQPGNFRPGARQQRSAGAQYR